MRGLRAPAVGYAWLLLGAVVMMILIVIAANVGSTGAETGVESDDTNSIGVLIGMPFQIAAMALLGSLQFTDEGVGASLYLPPLILTGLYMLMAFRAACRGDAIPAAGTRAILGAIVGFAAAAIVTPLTFALAMRSDGPALHAASVGLFFGTWVLTALASFAGTTRAAQAAKPAWLATDYAVAARLWAQSVAVWLVFAVMVLAIVGSIDEGWWVAILAPVWGITGGLFSYALGHFGSLSFGFEGLNIGDFDTAWTIIAIVGAIALAVLTSIAWHLRRDAREDTLAQPGSWVAMPLAFGAGGLLTALADRVVLGGGGSEFEGSATLQPAFTLIPILLGWGAAIEVASRYVAPSLAAALPAGVATTLRGPESNEVPVAAEPVAAVEARPLTPEERARYKKIGIASGALVAVGIAGWIAVTVVNSQVYGPESQVASYLDAVVDGDLEKVNELAPTDDDLADDRMLTDSIYRSAGSRITNYELGDIDTSGDGATVTVRLEGLDGDAETELTLQKDGTTGLFFNKWRIADGGLAKVVSISMPYNAGGLSVNDESVEAVDGDVWLLPGSYVFNAASGNKWLESSGDPFTVLLNEDYQFAEIADAVTSEAFRTEVQAQIDAYLAKCMESTELEPDGCPNSSFAGTDVRNVKWKLEQAPTPDFSSFDGTFPADLSYGESGRVSLAYESDESYGFGPKDWQPQEEEGDIYLSSVIVTEEGDTLAVTISE